MKTKAFIRRVGFGLKPDEPVPSNPLDWAYNQKAIKQIYLEGNFFSKQIINKFMKLKNDKPDIAMIIEWPSEEFKKMVLDNYK